MRSLPLAALVLVTTAGAARAQSEEEGPSVVVIVPQTSFTKATWPAALVERPLTLAAGMAELQLNVGLNLSDGAVLKPITLAPNLYYGVTDRFTIGIAHTTHFLDAGLGGLCLMGDTDCGSVRYRFVAADALVSVWRPGNYEVIVRGGVDVTAVLTLPSTGTSYKVALRIAGALRYHYGAFGVDVSVGGAIGTPAYFYLPVYLYYQASGNVALGFTAAGRAGDGGALSAGVLVLGRVARDVDLGVGFELPTLSHTSAREATLTMNWRL